MQAQVSVTSGDSSLMLKKILPSTLWTLSQTNNRIKLKLLTWRPYTIKL